MNSDKKIRLDIKISITNFESESDIEKILAGLDSVIKQDGYITIYDLLEHADLDGFYIDEYEQGWTNLTRTEIVKENDIFTLNMPETTLLI